MNSTTNKHNALTALVLTVVLLFGIVGLGLYSALAATSTSYKVSELEVRQGEDKQWYAYKKGTTQKATRYYGVVPNSYGWWRVENGKVNFKASGVFYNDYGYWVISNGKVNFDYEGFLELDYTVNQKSGSKIYSNEKGETTTTSSGKTSFWYLKDGKVQTGYTGAKSATINGKNGWWRIEGGRVNQTYTGVASNEYGWWYFKNGTVDFTKTGVEQNSYGWWRIENGKVNFDYTGIASNDYGSWYIENGKVDFSYNGAFALDGVMYIIENGKVVETSNYTVSALPVLRPTVVYMDSGAQLSWSAPKVSGNQTIDGYEIYVKDSPTGSYSKVGSVDAKTTTFKHELGWTWADPSQTTRLYDVRAVTKNKYGIVTASSPERTANAANNYVGGAFQLVAPDIVSVTENTMNYTVTFKKVPYATSYDIYMGTSASNLRKVSSVKAEGTGAGTEAAAKAGFSTGNQTATVTKQVGAQYLSVQAVTSEKSSSGYTAVTIKSDYDTGFKVGQTQLKGQNILFMGDSLMAGTPYGPTTMDYTVSTRVGQQTGANVYNCAVGGATLVSDYPRLINNSIYHNQNLLVANGTHENFTNGKWSGVSNLTDFDIVVLEGGPNDFFNRVPLGTIDSTTKSQFYGALNLHMSLLKEASKKRVATGEERTKVVLVDIFYSPEGDSANLLGLKYSDYKAALKAIADKYDNDPDIDVYWYTGTESIVNAANIGTTSVDNVHMTAYYYGQIGNHMAAFLKTLEAKEHSEETTTEATTANAVSSTNANASANSSTAATTVASTTTTTIMRQIENTVSAS